MYYIYLIMKYRSQTYDFGLTLAFLELECGRIGKQL